jgi:membrane associated rhomboid family serine protease
VSVSPRPAAFSPGPIDRASALSLIDEAARVGTSGEFEQAAEIYRRLIGHRDPDIHVAALLGLAECMYRTDHDDAAVEAWTLATRAPDTPISWSAWKQLAAARVRAGDLHGAKAAYREAERRAPAAERPEIASRLGWLNKETGNARGADRYFARSRTVDAFTPVVTWTVLAVTVAIGLSGLFTNRATAGLVQDLLLLDKERVADGEWYRLVSVTLVHGGLLHLATNMYALFMVGPLIERLYGRVGFVAIYLLTAAFASTASYLFLRNDAVGASGAIFGLFGLLAVSMRVHRPMLGRDARAMARQIGILILINLLLGFGLAGSGVPIDNTAHVGGLIAGAWLGLLIPPRGPRGVPGAGGVPGAVGQVRSTPMGAPFGATGVGGARGDPRPLDGLLGPAFAVAVLLALIVAVYVLGLPPGAFEL